MKTRPFADSVEPLESRIAPSAVVTFTDVDGDLVTVKTSKGSNIDLAAILTRVDTGLGEELQRIDFSQNAAVFAGTTLTVTAKRTVVGGDGRVNVGYIDASTAGGGTALDLGMVTIGGDLGQIDAGDATTATAAVKGLKVQSMGQFGTSTQGMAGSLESNLTGALGSLKVTGNLKDAYIHVIGGADGKIGSITIGGSLIGGTGDYSGFVSSTGAIGPVSVLGNVEGGSGAASGSIFSLNPIARVTLGGSLLGGSGNSSGAIRSGAVGDFSGVGAMGAVKIGGSIEGGGGSLSGYIESETNLAGLTVGGSIRGGDGDGSGTVFIVEDTGPVRVFGNVEGGGGEGSGRILAFGTLGNVTLGGSLLGGPVANNSGRIFGDNGIGATKIGGDVRGGAGQGTGLISSNGAAASVTIVGSLIGGSGNQSGGIDCDGVLGAVRIDRNLIGGDANGAVVVEETGFISAARLTSLVVGGSIIAGTESGGGTLVNSGAVRISHDIGAITIKGSLIGNATHSVLITARGQATPGATTDVAIKSLTVSGRVEQTDILAGYDTADVPSGVNADAQIGAVVVGDWIASNLVAGVQDDGDAARDAFFGDAGDQKIAGGSAGTVSKIASILIKGTALGTVGGVDFFGFVAQQIGSFKVGATAFPLTKGPANNLAGLLIGVTDDLRVREVGL